MFFAKLGFQNLRKNKQIYLPFLISMIFIVAINTMIHLLVYNQGMETLGTREGVEVAFRLGQIVIMLFTWIFSVYTHRFLIKQRTRELGLYNILGLGKSDLYRVSFWEICYSFFFSISFGVISGYVLFKLTSLLLMKMFEIGEQFIFQIEGSSLLFLFLQFSGIFLLLFLLNCRYIYKTNPLELLTSAKKGEKEPKSKKLLTLIGVLSLVIGYWIAATIHSPFEAMLYFVVAVVLVILATYTLFIGGSITFLRFLKKRKKIYYRPRLFISISSMMYRMKQNAAGLASICILSTMALITISTTASLYFGRETDLNVQYPYDYSFATSFDNKKWVDEVYQLAEEENVEITENHEVKTSKELLYLKENGQLQWVYEAGLDFNEARKIARSNYHVFISLEEYNRQMHTSYTLSEDEVLVDELENVYKKQDTLNFGDNLLFHVKDKVSGFKMHQFTLPFNQIVLVVMPNDEVLNEVLNATVPENYQGTTIDRWWYQVDFNFETKEDDQRINFASQLSEQLSRIGSTGVLPEESGYSYRRGERDLVSEVNRDFDSSFFFIGMLLSIVFILGTVLIIYFKQISEGLEDRERFIILQKVGMSRAEVKKTIRQQVLMFFSLPLLTAFSHLLFAFPMIKQLLLLFEIAHTQVFLYATLLVAVAFTILYFIVYLLTARTYYQIVERENP